MRGVAIAAVLLLGLGLPAPASAQQRGDGHHGLGLLFAEFGPNLGGPMGFLGGALGVLPSEWLGLRVGGAWDWGGPQATWTLDAYLPLGRQTLGLEIGSTLGPHEYDNGVLWSEPTHRFRWTLAHRGHVGLTVRFRSGRSWLIRFFTGYRRILNPGDARCIDSDGETCTAEPSSHDGWWLLDDLEAIYAGGAFAYTFDP